MALSLLHENTPLDLGSATNRATDLAATRLLKKITL